MPTGNNKDLNKLVNKVNSESGQSCAEEILKLQATRQLKNEYKKVSQMTGLEKQLYVEMEQKIIAEYEREFLSNKPSQYNGKLKKVYSPHCINSSGCILHGWQKLRHGFPFLNLYVKISNAADQCVTAALLWWSAFCF